MFQNSTHGLFQSDDDKLKEGYVICFRCGICCTKYQVNISLIEGRLIADVLGLDWNKFIAEYTDPRWPGTNSLLLIQLNGACVFFKQVDRRKETSCLIHTFRPASCRDWTPGWHRRECQEGLARYWGLAVDSSGKLQGDEKRIKRFQSFSQALEGRLRRDSVETMEG